MTEQSKLPQNWCRLSLGEVSEINPTRPKQLNRDDSTPTSFVPMDAVDDQKGTITKRYTRPFIEIKKGYTYFAEGDVLFAKITPCMQNGKHAIAEELIDNIGFGTTEFHVIRPSSRIISRWIHFYLRQPHILQKAEYTFTGSAGQQRVPVSFLTALEIPVPPIEEQRRIVAVLDEKLTAIEQARQAAQAQLKAAKALPAAYLRAIFDSPEAQNWPMKPLREICLYNGQYGTSDKSHHIEQGIPVLGMGNIFEGRIRWDNLKFIELSEQEANKYRLKHGDILFNRTNSAELVGKTAVFDNKRDAVFASYLVRFETNSDVADSHFVSAYINSQKGRQFIETNMVRAIGQVNISASTMHKMPIPIPSLAVQKMLMADLQTNVDRSNKVIESIKQQIKEIETMFAAYLRQAFNGKL